MCSIYSALLIDFVGFILTEDDYFCKIGNFRENFIFANSVKDIFAM